MDIVGESRATTNAAKRNAITVMEVFVSRSLDRAWDIFTSNASVSGIVPSSASTSVSEPEPESDFKAMPVFRSTSAFEDEDEYESVATPTAGLPSRKVLVSPDESRRVPISNRKPPALRTSIKVSDGRTDSKDTEA
ncbi:hypothetical protein SISNIDRAFT_470558 [Sistotremastrum niveocremeum HHB9708]|uniref:Uncharacterized protein n=1 Tax=Sistotremastrum niveocremeum HHB9708 TaxID=1314777 RepID=A0A164NQQ2_9AGAM|nr:hypothetical protein SISNIDRAFT_470558 [Sistotremastrum niveocremeum HHB9708]